jgi:hypothetical protein
MCGSSPEALITDISVAAIVQYAVGQRPLNIHLFIITLQAPIIYSLFRLGRILYLDLDVQCQGPRKVKIAPNVHCI